MATDASSYDEEIPERRAASLGDYFFSLFFYIHCGHDLRKTPYTDHITASEPRDQSSLEQTGFMKIIVHISYPFRLLDPKSIPLPFPACPKTLL